MSETNFDAQMLLSPFISSFISRARPGDLADSDASRRAQAWAYWAMCNLSAMKGNGDREYTALTLNGRFYDPKNKNPELKPHLEIPAHKVNSADREFPDRLSQMGNGLNFPWWIVPEVTALRRALFNHPEGNVHLLVEALNERRVGLVDSLKSAGDKIMPSWDIIESKLLNEPKDMIYDCTSDFTTEEISQLFPPALDFNLKIIFDARLKESSKDWAAKRVGVWQITGEVEGSKIALGVVTPRLTSNSLFKDPLFSAEKESPAALLVRTLLLRRLAKNQLNITLAGVASPGAAKIPGGPYLRSVVPKAGGKTPQASIESAERFLKAYPDSDNAWSVLTSWAGSTFLLTVSEDGFKASHRNALRFLHAEKEPLRDDIDVILPLAWEQGPSPRVVRVTFAKGQNDI